MFRASLVWVVCMAATLVAVSLTHVGILAFEIFTRLPSKSSATLLVAALLPLFFLCLMAIFSAFLFVWSLRRLFKQPANLPDFM